MTAYDPEARYEVERVDVEYRRVAGETLLASVYRPRGEGVFPALIDVHGGAWNGGARDTTIPVPEDIATTGLVVVSVDFRLAPAHPYPAQVCDVNYATRWLKAHAAELRADASCLGGIGSSSGGHTIMLSCMRPDDVRYAGEAVPGGGGFDASLDYVILCWAVLDSFARYEYAKRTGYERLVLASEAYFGGEEAMREGNPTLLLERGEPARMPPALLLQGTADDNIPISIPERFVAAYRARGGDVQYEVFPGEPHRFMGAASASTERGLALIRSFVARQLAVKGAPARM